MDVKFFQNIPPHIWELIGKLDLSLNHQENNPAIIELLQKTILVGGKRFRPLLTFLMGDFFNVDSSILSHYARAIEYVHAASLAHDDVVDNATKRRGADSINIVASNKKAVLAGDYLLSNVIVDVCRLGNIELVTELSLVIKDLSDGEWLQLESGRFENLHWDYIEQIALKKTASVMSWCCVTPAILAGAPSHIVEDARDFGKKLGLAFQLIDDTLDYSDLDITGKDTTLDLKNGIINSVTFEALSSFLNSQGTENWFSSETFSTEILENKISQLTCVSLSSAGERVRGRAYQILDEARFLLNRMTKDPFFKGRGKLLERSDDRVAPLLFVLDYLFEREK